MKKKFLKILSLLLAVCTILPTAVACKNGNGGDGTGTSSGGDSTTPSGISNENTPFAIASEALDGVFNPFYYTSGADGNVIGLTQIGMLTTDKNGNITCGKDADSVALNYSYITKGTSADFESSGNYDNYYTTYYFALKNGIKFSNGQALSIKDVLFNLYVLLDPIYTGSSTLYSTNIRGLGAYRAQTVDENQQKEMDSYFLKLAADRINAVVAWCDDEKAEKSELTDEAKEVIAKAEELFRAELQSDWSSSSDTESYKKYGFTEQWQVFLYKEGLITVKSEKDRETGVITYEVDMNGYDKVADHSEAAMIKTVYDANMNVSSLSSYKTKLRAVVAGGWTTATNLKEYFKGVEISKYFSDPSKKQIKSISGITTYKATSIPSAEGGDIALGEECDILQIVVNGVDPKAIYNFSFTVAPMSYYSTEAEIGKFSIEDGNFGVAFSNQAFFDQLQIKQVPVGAGPYKASNADTSCAAESSIPSKNEFFSNNIVYYERNNNFYTVFGSDTSKNAKIRKVRYKVISTDQMFNAVTGSNPEVYYSEPQATNTNINKLKDLATTKYALANNMGYGYIGINAGKVKDVNVRRAIMYCMDVGLCLDYYGGSTFASILNRSMSKNSWAYPEGCLPYYAEFSYDCEYDGAGNISKVGKFNDKLAMNSAKAAVAEAGYNTLDPKTGKLKNANGETLTFTFTIAGDSNDHPAYATMQKAANLLNEIGFDVTVTKDASALSKLASGGLTVWAAAWSSTIDPDMYQVYHKDSSATSIKNWGFPYIVEEGTSEEQEWLDQLALLIEDARATMDQNERKGYYAEALDLVMELAVELATYQRKNLFIWNSAVIDSSTLCEATAYQSPLSKIWEVSLAES